MNKSGVPQWIMQGLSHMFMELMFPYTKLVAIILSWSGHEVVWSILMLVSCHQLPVTIQYQIQTKQSGEFKFLGPN